MVLDGLLENENVSSLFLSSNCLKTKGFFSLKIVSHKFFVSTVKITILLN